MACLSRYRQKLIEDVYKEKGNCPCYRTCEVTDYKVDSESTYAL
jgi:hypothetical protein